MAAGNVEVSKTKTSWPCRDLRKRGHGNRVDVVFLGGMTIISPRLDGAPSHRGPGHEDGTEPVPARVTLGFEPSGRTWGLRLRIELRVVELRIDCLGSNWGLFCFGSKCFGSHLGSVTLDRIGSVASGPSAWGFELLSGRTVRVTTGVGDFGSKLGVGLLRVRLLGVELLRVPLGIGDLRSKLGVGCFGSVCLGSKCFGSTWGR